MECRIALLKRVACVIALTFACLTLAYADDLEDFNRAIEAAMSHHRVAFIRTSGVFDGVIDFDAATLDPATGGMKPEFVPESTTGGPGDKLHPNRAGYLAMGNANLDMVMGKTAPTLSARKK